MPIQNLFDWLETNSIEDFLENFPSVNREQAVEVLKLAEQMITDQKFLNENTA